MDERTVLYSENKFSITTSVGMKSSEVSNNWIVVACLGIL